VIGFFLQREELQRSSRAIDLQYQEMRRSAEQAEVQAFLRVAEQVDQRLGATLGLLFMSSQSIAAGGDRSDEEIQANWSALGTGDRFAFGRAMMSARFRADTEQEIWALFWSTPIRTRHSETFIEVFESMIQRARACDADGLLVETLRGSTHGRIYDVMQQSRGFAPPVRS
jgi:hypothetical protein